MKKCMIVLGVGLMALATMAQPKPQGDKPGKGGAKGRQPRAKVVRIVDEPASPRELAEEKIDRLEEKHMVDRIAEFIASPDPEVAEYAFDAWERLVSDLPGNLRAAAIVKAAAAIQAVPPPAPVPVVVPAP